LFPDGTIHHGDNHLGKLILAHHKVYVNIARTTTCCGLAARGGLYYIYPPVQGIAHSSSQCIRCGECLKCCPKNALHWSRTGKGASPEEVKNMIAEGTFLQAMHVAAYYLAKEDDNGTLR